jgi:hypothetical protein
MRSPSQLFAPIVFVSLLGVWLYSGLAFSQEASTHLGLSPGLIQSRIAEVEADFGLTDEERRSLIALYRNSLGFVETARSNSEAGDAFARAGQTASDEAQEILKESEEASAEPGDGKLDFPEDAGVRQVQQSLLQERANQAAASARFSGIEQQLTIEANRPGVARQRLLEAKQQTEELSADLKTPPRADQAPLVIEAVRWTLTEPIVSRQAPSRCNIPVSVYDAEELSAVPDREIDLISDSISTGTYCSIYPASRVSGIFLR